MVIDILKQAKKILDENRREITIYRRSNCPDVCFRCLLAQASFELHDGVDLVDSVKRVKQLNLPCRTEEELKILINRAILDEM